MHTTSKALRLLSILFLSAFVIASPSRARALTEKTIYLGTGFTSGSKVEAFSMTEVATDLGYSSASALENSSFFVRWGIYDPSGNLITKQYASWENPMIILYAKDQWNSNLNFSNGYYYMDSSTYNGYADWRKGSVSDLFTPVMLYNGFDLSSGYKLKCDVSTNATLSATASDDSFNVRYTIVFDDEPAPADPFENYGSNIIDYGNHEEVISSGSTQVTFTLSQFSELNNLSAIYARVVVLNDRDKAVDPTGILTGSNFITCATPTLGIYSTTFRMYDTFTLSNPLNYHLLFYFSNYDVLGELNGSLVEPEINGQFILSFKRSYDATNINTVTTEYRTAEVDLNESMNIATMFKVGEYDGERSRVDEMCGGSDKMRYFRTWIEYKDDDGNWTPVEHYGNAYAVKYVGDGNLTPVSLGEQYGYYRKEQWWNFWSSIPSTQQFAFTGNGDTNVTRYRQIYVFSTDWQLVEENGSVIGEPELNGKFIYSFTMPFKSVKLSKSYSHTVELSDPCSYTFSLGTLSGSTLTDGKSFAPGNPSYARIILYDKDGNPVINYNGLLEVNATTYPCTNISDGLYITDFNQSTTITLNTEYLPNYSLAVYFTSNTDSAYDEGVLVKEPTVDNLLNLNFHLAFADQMINHAPVVNGHAIIDDMGDIATRLYTDYNGNLEGGLTTPTYVRVWVEEKSGNTWTPITDYTSSTAAVKLLATNMAMAPEEQYGFYLQGSDIWNADNIIDAPFYLITPSDYHKYHIVYALSDKTDFLANSLGEIVKEPSIDVKYIFTLKYDEFPNISYAANKKHYAAATKYFDPLDTKFSFNIKEIVDNDENANLQDWLSNATYVRVRLTDIDGNVVRELTEAVAKPSLWTDAPKAIYGYYAMSPTANTWQQNFSFTLPNGYALTDLRAEVLFSEQDNAVWNGSTLATEPTIDHKMIVTFDQPFSLPFAGEEEVITIYVPRKYEPNGGDWQLCMYPRHTMIAYHFTETDLWVPIHFEDIPTQAEYCGEGKTLWLRWWLRDADGNEVALPSADQFKNYLGGDCEYLRSSDGQNMYWSSQLGCVWPTPDANASGEDAFKGTMMGMLTTMYGNLQAVSPLTRDVILDLSTNQIDAKHIDGTDVIRQPEVTRRIVFRVVERDFEAVNLNTVTTVEKHVTIGDNGTVPVNIWSYNDEILSHLDGKEPTFMRLYVEKKDANGSWIPRSSYGKYVLFNDANFTALSEPHLGFYKQGTGIWSESGVDPVPFTLVEPTTADMYRIVYTFSNINDSPYTAVDGPVAAPTLNVKYVFYIDQDPFVNLNVTTTSRETINLDSQANSWSFVLNDLTTIQHKDKIKYVRVQLLDIDGTVIPHAFEKNMLSATNFMECENSANGYYKIHPTFQNKITITAESGHDIEEYTLVCYFSEIDPDPNSTATSLDREPEVNQMVYIYFSEPWRSTSSTPAETTITYSFPATASTDYPYIDFELTSTTKHKATFYMDYGGQKIGYQYDTYSEYSTAADVTNVPSKPTYIRWYVRDKSGIERFELAPLISGKKADYTLAGGGDQYQIYAKGDKSLTDLCNIRLNINDYNLFDCELVADISNQAVTDSDGDGMPDAEPAITNRVVIEFEHTKFKHYVGYGNTDECISSVPTGMTHNFGGYDTCPNGELRQKVHEWTYYVYVEPGTEKMLKLPIEDVEGEGNATEPQAYFRWYDYNTDFASDAIRPYYEEGCDDENPGFSMLRNSYYDTDPDGVSRSRGLFAMCIGMESGDASTKYGWTIGRYATIKSCAAVVFNAPSEEDGWEYTVACDVSKYIDGISTHGVDNTPWTCLPDFKAGDEGHEPTLSIRYKYVIRPAKKIADDIKSQVELDVKDHNWIYDNLLEDYASFFIGIPKVNGGGATAALRTSTNDVTIYWYYPYIITSRVSSQDKIDNAEIGSIKEVSWGTKPVQCQKMRWRVYDSSAQYCAKLDNKGEAGEFTNISLDILNNLEFYPRTSFDYGHVQDATDPPVKIEFDAGSYVYVIGYGQHDYEAGEEMETIAGQSTRDYDICPIVRYIVRFLPDCEPRLFEEIEGTHRSIEYLRSNYQRVGMIDFDDPNDLGAPTDPYNNLRRYPFAWDKASYGYCYPDLYDSLYGNGRHHWGLAAMHGDYNMMKTMAVDGISIKSDGYSNTPEPIQQWYTENPTGVMDRTYALSGGSLYGHFIYIDASDEARPIAEVEFNADLCVGSCLAFTVAVADLTDPIQYNTFNSLQTQPQVVFKLYGVSTDPISGEATRHLVHAYTSGDFMTQIRQGSQDSSGAWTEFGDAYTGLWYQIYGKMYFREGSDVDQYSNFVISLENFCDGTKGADYGVDDIRVYISNGKSFVDQQNSTCGLEDDDDEDVRLKIKMEQRTLMTMLPVDAFDDAKIEIWDEDHTAIIGYTYSTDTSTWPSLHYRICNNANGEAVENMPTYDRKVDENGNYVYDADGNPVYEHQYASVPIPPYIVYQDFDADESTSELVRIPEEFRFKTDEFNNLVQLGFEKDDDGFVYFVFALEDFPLGNYGYYYVSIATLEDGDDIKNDSWGTPTVNCSLYSDRFTPLSQKLQLLKGESLLDKIVFYCGEPETKEVSVSGDITVPDANGVYQSLYQNTGLKINFDWSVAIWDSASKQYVTDPASVQTGWQLENYGFTFGNTYRIFAQVHSANDGISPVAEDPNAVATLYDNDDLVVSLNGLDYVICNQVMYLDLNTDLGGPSMRLGFPDVDYSEVGNDRYLRIGLPQINDMKAHKLPLRVPVNQYVDHDGNTEYPLTALTGNVVLIATNDPYYLDEDGDVAMEPIDGNTTHGYTIMRIVDGWEVTTDKQYVDFRFHAVGNDLNDSFEFHEGYWYYVNFDVLDQRDTETQGVVKEGTISCVAKTDLYLEIVPEYTTWTNAEFGNTNWLWDGNWTRSTAEELYKTGTTGLETNSDSYQNYPLVTDTNDKRSALTHMPTYVPMKFTKVTVPEKDPAYLSDTWSINGQGLIMSTANNDMSPATENIEYRMMAEWPRTADYYGCERFYGNTCAEIYFKPNGELRYQHYLHYDKAWVEKEFGPNKWYTFASPLLDTYAGDMYVPATGQQTTEAFVEITFDHDATVNGAQKYSRTAYPIYQRSWDQPGSQMMLPSGDVRGESYDAYIDYTNWKQDDTYSAVETNWSHTYNDVTEPYEPGQGVAIRTLRSDLMPASGEAPNTLLRLPKDDANYDYYWWDDVTDHNGGSLNQAVSRDNSHMLATKEFDDYGRKTIHPHEDSIGEDKYVLTGNPYMATMYMAAFFDNNPFLDKKFWFIDGDQLICGEYDSMQRPGQDAELAKVKPMQAFFVKIAEDAVDSEGNLVLADKLMINFWAEMTTPPQVATVAALANDPAVSITASTAAGASAARLAVVDSADDDFVANEDVEVLLDSNLSHVPTVYTVAGNMATMLNRMAELDVVPLGVSLADALSDSRSDSDSTMASTDVTLTFNFSQYAMPCDLYLWDITAGTSVEISDGSQAMVKANDHGRYFLASMPLPTLESEELDASISIYSPAPGTIVVASPALDEIERIEVFTIDGKLSVALDWADAPATITLPAGIYIVRAISSSDTATAKLRIR